jgi:hypothetical protein
LKIPHLVRWVRQYVKDIDPNSTDSWEELRTYFIDKHMEHIDDQATLATAGIANSAEVDEELNEIKYEVANMAEKTEQLEDALVSIAAFMAGTKHQPPAPAPAPLSMEQKNSAFVAAQQRKEAPKEQSAINKAIVCALGELNNKGGGGGGGGSGGNSRTKRTRKPSKRCIFYCFSHGCNFSHNEPECKEKKTGKSDAATYTNLGLGKMWNKDIYTGSGCLPCNTT